MSDKNQSVDRMRGFGPGGGPRSFAVQAPPVRNLGATLGRIWGYLRPYRLQLMGPAALVAVTTALTLLSPYLIRLAIDRGIIGKDVAYLARVALAMLVTVALAALGLWVQSVLMVHISQRAVRDIRRDLFAKLQTLSLRFFDRRPHGEVLSSLTNDTETISRTLGETVTQLMSSVLSVIGAVAAMFLLSWQLALVTLVTLPVTVLMTGLIARAARQSFRDRQRDLAKLNGIVEETVSGQRVIKVSRREPQAIEQFEGANATLRSSATRADILGGVMGPAMGLMRNSTFAVLAAVGAWMILRDWTTIGVLAAFITYAQHFSRPIHQIASLYATVQSAIAGAERIFDIMDEVPDVVDAPDAVAIDEVRGEVCFENVTFGYDEEPVLKDVSFTAKPGQTIALVGPTGAGKTTIVNLLTRFYDIDSGSIRVDGHEIDALRTDDLRRALGIVLQDTFLFADSVRENIRYGRLDASDEEVEQAARLANADSFINRLPHGYETPLSEAGSTLSEGQRQLLAIARAILADPAILILDEATSSVDPRTEAHIQKAMLRLMAGRTSFVIAHRLSTIRRADCILVIQDGRIVERGTHEELLAAEGVYHDLHKSQFGGEVAA